MEAYMKNKLITIVSVLLIFSSGIIGADINIQSKLIELETKFAQLEMAQKKKPTDIQLIGSLDTRFARVQDGKNTGLLHEATIGFIAHPSDWISTHLELAYHLHDGQGEMGVHEGFMNFKLSPELSTQIGMIRLPIGIENRGCFFSRQRITHSLITETLFGHEGWVDFGKVVTYKPSWVDEIKAGIVNGDNDHLFDDGTGQDQISVNNSMPAFLDVKKSFDDLTLGAAYAYGNWDASDYYHFSLTGLNAQYKIGELNITSEYFSMNKTATTANTHLFGWYVNAAYVFNLDSFQYGKNLELLVSYGEIDTGMGDTANRLAFQAMMLIDQGVKWRAIYEINTEAPTDTRNNRYISQLAIEI
jgi:hypothetical protein